MENSTLPECVKSSCAPCNVGASTMCISFPYQNIGEVTATVSVIPYVTQYDDGRLETTYSTITVEEHPDQDYFDDEFTWVTHGRTLTWPTTYGTLEGFVARADPTFEPTKTDYGDRDCDGTAGTSDLTLPATMDPGSFIIALGTESTTLKPAPLPQTIIDYLDSFETVHEQLNNIPITSCAPALPVHTACTTVLTSTSTRVSCVTETNGAESCITETATLVETDTHIPFWPTLNGSQTDLKVTAARLTTETGEATTVRATAEPALVPASDEPEDQPQTTDNADDREPSADSASEPEASSPPDQSSEANDDQSQGEPGASTSTTVITTTPPTPSDSAVNNSPSSDTAGLGSGSALDTAAQNPSGTSQPSRSSTNDAVVAEFTGVGSNLLAPSVWALMMTCIWALGLRM